MLCQLDHVLIVGEIVMVVIMVGVVRKIATRAMVTVVIRGR